MDYTTDIARMQDQIGDIVSAMSWILQRVGEDDNLYNTGALEVLVGLENVKYELECLIDSYKMEQRKAE